MNKKSKKKSNFGAYFQILLWMIVGGVCGFLFIKYSENYLADAKLSIKLLSVAAMVICLYASVIFNLIVHEAGHLIFGLMTGYKFGSFRIFNLMLLKTDGKLKLKRLSIAGTGGQCIMCPPDIVDGKMPVVLYNLGGSIINLFFGAVFLLVAILCKHIPVLFIASVIFSLVGFVTALMNGIPLSTDIINNDGYNAISLRKDPLAMRSFWVQLKTTEQIAKGARLKDLPKEWFIIPTDEEMKNSMVSALGVFACNKLMDEGKFEEADNLMAHFLEIESGIVGLHRFLMICDRIYIEAIGQCRVDVIEKMMSPEQIRFMKQMKSFPSVIRTEYVYALLCKKDNEKAEGIMAYFEKAGKKYPYPQDIESERELIDIANKKYYNNII